MTVIIRRFGDDRLEDRLSPHPPFATLLDAWHRIEDNDGAPGVDGVTLDDFELRVEENLSALERDLRERLYLPQPFLRASMPKPGGGRRELAIPTVRDRVAQSAAALVITPILDLSSS